MGKGLIIGKRVISIQLSKNNALQDTASNALTCLIIPNKKKNSSNKKKPKKLVQTQEKSIIILTLHSFWHCDGLKFSSHILLTPKLLPSLKSQCPT